MVLTETQKNNGNMEKELPSDLTIKYYEQTRAPAWGK